MSKRSTHSKSDLARPLQQVGIFLLIFHLVIRLVLRTENLEHSLDFFVHSLVWVGAAFWMWGKAFEGGLTLRVAGLDVAMLLWIALCIFSILQASYVLVAVKHAFVFASLPILFWWILAALGPQRRGLLFQTLLGAAFAFSVWALLQRMWFFPELQADKELLRNISPALHSRVMASEVFSTFFYPNSFSGFLVLLLPIQLALWIELHREKSKGSILLLNAAGILLSAMALFWTGSKGGWVALGVAGTVFFALLLSERSGQMRKRIYRSGLAVIVIVGGLVVAGPLHPSRLEPYSASLEIRNVYREAGIKIAKEHPFTGIGLDNFQEHYPEYKSEAPHEVRKAHDDYLQILIEMGIPGLILLLLIFFRFVRAGLFRNQEELPPAESPPSDRKFLIGAVIAACLLGTFLSHPTLWLLAIPWIAYIILTDKEHAKILEGDLRFLRIGAAAGLAGLLVHLTVDYDLYDFGVATTLFVVGALLVMMQRKTSAFQLGPRASALGGFVLLLIVAPIMFFLLPSLRASEEAIRESQNLKQENLISFLEKLDAAKGATALHPEIHRLEAQTAMVLWRQTRDRYISSPTPPMDQLAQEQRIENAMERAILRQSRGIGLYLYRAQLRLEFWEEGTRRALSQGSHLLQKQAEAHLLRAKDDVDMAFRLYPTSAANHYVKASILDLQHRPEEAKRLYQEALRLSDNAGRANAPSQELRPFEKSHALLRLQDNKGAVRAMEEHFRILLSATNVPSPLVQRALNEFRKTVRQQTAFWYHPVMDAVADQAIANLLEKP